MQQDRRTEIAASMAAHRDLGPAYDGAIAEGLVERLGEEIDRRVDARVKTHQEPPAPAAPAAPPVSVVHHNKPGSVAAVFMTLGSIGLGVGATAVATSLGKNAAAQVVMVLLIWVAITLVNVANRRRT